MANPSTFRYVESPCKDIDNVLESTTDIEYLPERRRLFPEFSVISPSEHTPPEDVDTREHLRVYARIKRVSGNSSEAMEESCVVVEGDGNLLLHVPSKNLSLKQGDRIEQTIQRFTFTQVYGPEVSQKEVFDNTVRPLVQEFLLGNNCLVFTYGVTNSGKTYTVQGTVKDGGLLPRTLDLLFNSLQGHVCSVPEYKPYRSSEVLHLDPRTIVEEQAAQSALLALAKKANRSLLDLDKTNGKSLTSTDGTLQESIMFGGPSQSLNELESRKAISDCVSLEPSENERIYSVWVAFYEIYNELIYDLLDFTPATRLAQRHILHMAEDQHKGPFIKDIKWVQVHNVIEVLTLLNAGRKNQSFASTKLNLNSSRSHSIFTIRLIRLEKGAKPEVTAINEFSICDLAGSERSSRTHNVADRLQEACNINTSLLALGKCITALRFNQQANRLNSRVVPFRESKLTRLFQVYLLGRGKTCMVVNINPSTSWYTENLNVLRFSAIAKQVLTHFPDRLGKRTQADCSSMIVSADGAVVPEKRARAGASRTASVACSRATIAKLVAAAGAATANAAVKPIQEAGGEAEGTDSVVDENCSEVNLDENDDQEMEVDRLKEELRKEREDRKLDEWRIRGEISSHLEYLDNLDEQQRKNNERTYEHMEDIWERRTKLLEETWKRYHEREMRELQETFKADKDLVPIERLEAETEKLREKAELAEQQAKRILELEATLVGLQQDVRALREAGEESRRQLELLPDSPVLKAQRMDLGTLKEANRELKVTLEEAGETFEKNRKEIKSLKQRSVKLEEELSTKDLLIEELRVSLASRDKQLSSKLSELASLKATEKQLRGPAFGKTQAQATPSKPQWQGDLSTNRTHIPKSLPAIRPLTQRSHGNVHQCGSAFENTQNVSPRLAQVLREVQLQSANKRGGAPGSEPAGCDDVCLSEALGDAERARAELREALEKASRLHAENSELLARCGQQEEHKQRLESDLAALRETLGKRGVDERLCDAEAKTNPAGARVSQELHRTKRELLEVMRTLSSKNKELEAVQADLEEVGILKAQNGQLAAECALQAVTLCEQAQALVALDRRLEGSCAELREKTATLSATEGAVAGLQAELAESRRELREERDRLEVARDAAEREASSSRRDLAEVKAELADLLAQLGDARREAAEKIAELEEARVRLAELGQLKTQNEELFNKSMHQADTLKEVTEDCENLRKELEQCLKVLRDKRGEADERTEDNDSKAAQTKAGAELAETRSKLAETRQELERATKKYEEAQKELADVRACANSGSGAGNFHRTMAALEERCERMAGQSDESESGVGTPRAEAPEREVKRLRELLAEHEAASAEAKARETRLRREAHMAQDALKAANRLMGEWEAKLSVSKVATASGQDGADRRCAPERTLVEKEEPESVALAEIAALERGAAEKEAEASGRRVEGAEGRVRAVPAREEASAPVAGTDGQNRGPIGASQATRAADVERLEATVAELAVEKEKLFFELSALREANGALCQELQVCEETMRTLESRLGTEETAERRAERARAEKAALEEELASVRAKLRGAAEESDDLREKLSDVRRQMQHVEKEMEMARAEKERSARLEQELEKVRTQGAQCMAGRDRQLQVLRRELQQEREKSPSPQAAATVVAARVEKRDDLEPVVTPLDSRWKEAQRELTSQLKEAEQRRNVESKKEQELRAWREERDLLASGLASEFDSLRTALAERDAEISRLNAVVAANAAAKAPGETEGSAAQPKGAPRRATESPPQRTSAVRRRRPEEEEVEEEEDEEEDKSLESRRRRNSKQPRLACPGDCDTVVLDRSDVSVDGGGHVPRFPRSQLAIHLSPLKQHQLLKSSAKVPSPQKASDEGRSGSRLMKLRSKTQLKGGCEQDGGASGKTVSAGTRLGAGNCGGDTGATGPMQRIGDFLQSSPTRLKSCAKQIASTFKSAEAVNATAADAAKTPPLGKRKCKRKLLKLEISSPMDFSSHTFVDNKQQNAEKESDHNTIMRQLRRRKQ
uniref:Kinesin-like protein KIF20B isoform X2 n=1 Tax=Petromyzon marinus TaxID=7757 RepID=A0AAJ7WSH7_PETMA|nr:kinesin-like protein KIF20B isoform X2 [Petromyzon marinus]